MNEQHLRDAIARLGPHYRPRTHHLGPDGAPKYTNRLILEASPYLLQHAHNPVDWRPWGPEAFAEARQREVPVFLSVGYSTCHWCHVMERESFEDEEVAAFLNEHYVPIKVDREERPDVDAVFMEFVQLTTGHGGWPMSVFLTPDQVPLYGGTYFPARDGDRGSHVGFLTILRAIRDRWQDPRFSGQGARVMDEIRKQARPQPGAEVPGPEVLIQGAAIFGQQFDPEWGGFGHAPKFPRPAVLDFLLRQWRRTGDEDLLRMVDVTFARMSEGGLYDHVGGGFARYSTDRQWLVPHFEKMLYDNAQLALTGLELWQATHEARHAEVVRDVLRWIDGEMSDPEGGFYSATDADSEGEEGRFFVWTPEEIDAAFGPGRAADAAWVKSAFGVTDAGNFEGRNVLHQARTLDAADRARWAELRRVLYAVRELREHPGLDDKVLTSWNALAISAFARAALVLDEPAYAARAARAADFVLGAMRRDGRLSRAWRKGQARHAGVLEDYAGMVGALLDLLEATGEARWLHTALELQATLDAHFADAEAGGYFRTADDAEALAFREKPDYDGAEPSGNSLAALALLRLAEITGDEAHRRRAEGLLRSLEAHLRRAPHAVPKLLCALEWLQGEVRQVVIVTPGDDRAAARPLLDEVRTRCLPLSMVLVGPAGGPLARSVPAFADREARGGAPTAYVCVGTRCDLPTGDPQVLARLLGG
jgi:uncharacterized protein YyaL (SSP411 family)